MPSINMLLYSPERAVRQPKGLPCSPPLASNVQTLNNNKLIFAAAYSYLFSMIQLNGPVYLRINTPELILSRSRAFCEARP